MKPYLDKDKLQDFLDRGVCREERQFSALLYYMFLEVKKGKKENENIIKRCLKIDNDSDMTVKDVYYEPKRRALIKSKNKYVLTLRE